MAKRFTGEDARKLRQRNGWSLQYLANVSGINKAYLSEFENGYRALPAEELQRLSRVLRQEEVAAGRASPQLFREGGHLRLVFVDPTGGIVGKPRKANLVWTEDDGTSYRMYLGWE